MIKKELGVRENRGFFMRMLLTSLVLFFVYLGDAILSDWVPGYMQDKLGGSLMMGLVMSFSSLIGFGADLVFPQILKGASATKLVVLGMGASLVFSGLLLWSLEWPVLVVFLTAMAVWGVYYEFLGFGSFQFVSENVPVHSRSAAWAILGVFKSLAYFLGPVIGGLVLLGSGNMSVVFAAAGLVIIGYLFFKIIGISKRKPVSEVSNEGLNIKEEIGHWRVLFEHVWPVLFISLMLGLVDATFWTTGTVLSDMLAESNWWGGLFLPFYMLPPVFVGFIVAKWGIYKGKKKMAERFMLLGGVFLCLLGVNDSVWFLLLAAFLTGTALSVAWPLTDAVYSDILARMGRERKHMIGLSSSTVSLAYIVGPVIAGLITSLANERVTFVVMGLLCVAVSIVLLIVTPRKLRLPQTEITEWK